MFCIIRLFSLNRTKAMILEIQNQSLVFLLSLRESLFPTRIRQRCRGICVGFIPAVLSPIGFNRFSHETFRFLLQSNRDFSFSKSKKSFQTRIWDLGENGSDYREYWIRNRFWPDFIQSIFDEEEIGRWTLDFLDWAVVYLGLQRRIPTQRELLREAPTILISTQGQKTRLWRRRLSWAIMEKMMRLSYPYWIWYFLLIYFIRHLICYGSLAEIFGYRRHDPVPLQATYQSIRLRMVTVVGADKIVYGLDRSKNRADNNPPRTKFICLLKWTALGPLRFSFIFVNPHYCGLQLMNGKLKAV